MSTAGISKSVRLKCLPDFRRREVAVPVEQRAVQFERESNAEHDRFRSFNDANLLLALKHEIPGAFVEIVARYQALMFRYARNFGIRPGERREWVSSLMHDVVLTLLKPGAVVPDSLGAYFARACRNKAYADHRAAVRRERHENEAASESLAAASASSVEDWQDDEIADDTNWSSSGLSPGLVKLAAKLDSAITPDERALLDWSSEAVPLRVIAEWLGISRSAAAQRVSRLKQRLRSIAPRIATDFSESEQADVKQFFQRIVKAEGAVVLNARLKGAIGGGALLSGEKRGVAAHGDINVR